MPKQTWNPIFNPIPRIFFYRRMDWLVPKQTLWREHSKLHTCLLKNLSCSFRELNLAQWAEQLEPAEPECIDCLTKHQYSDSLASLSVHITDQCTQVSIFYSAIRRTKATASREVTLDGQRKNLVTIYIQDTQDGPSKSPFRSQLNFPITEWTSWD